MISQNAVLSDPTGSSALLAAVSWLEGTLLGSIATIVATISVATIGYLAITGRIDLRRAATVVLGCFVLFGATSIAAGLKNLAAGMSDAQQSLPMAASLEVSPLAQPRSPLPASDPYAGASVPSQ